MVADTPLGLTEFLADLRAELDAARKRSDAEAEIAAQASEGALRLRAEEITVTVEVAHVATTGGEVAGKVGGKFWVFASAEASTKGSVERQRSGTQTLKLSPRIDIATTDEHGQQTVRHHDVDVSDQVIERPPV